jgi:UDP-3-O-[3-hydroxymyristoyl] glucosamine N-acyltransferase
VITAEDLAQRLGGVLEGEPGKPLRGAATLAEAGPEDVSWCSDAALLPQLRESAAGVVIIPQGLEFTAERTLIRVADAHLAMCAVLNWLGPPADDVSPGQDPSAVVAPDAVITGAHVGPHACVGARTAIGAGTRLHAGVRIGADVRIGRDCVIWPNVVIRERVTLGDRVIVHANTTIGSDGFGYLFRDGRQVKIPQVGIVVIEDDVEVGANVCIDRARSGVTRIGRGTKIDNLVQIGHNVQIGEHCVIVAQCGISGSTTLGRHVVLAGQVGIIDHLHIGDGAVVAAKSGVARDVPAGQTWRGVPARENGAMTRQLVEARRLPELARQMRELIKRVQALESTANDRTGS